MNRGIEKQIPQIRQLKGSENDGVRVVTLTPSFFGHKKKGPEFSLRPLFLFEY
jgi:hypothetical protein